MVIDMVLYNDFIKSLDVIKSFKILENIYEISGKLIFFFLTNSQEIDDYGRQFIEI